MPLPAMLPEMAGDCSSRDTQVEHLPRAEGLALLDRSVEGIAAQATPGLRFRMLQKSWESATASARRAQYPGKAPPNPTAASVADTLGPPSPPRAPSPYMCPPPWLALRLAPPPSRPATRPPPAAPAEPVPPAAPAAPTPPAAPAAPAAPTPAAATAAGQKGQNVVQKVEVEVEEAAEVEVDEEVVEEEERLYATCSSVPKGQEEWLVKARVIHQRWTEHTRRRQQAVLGTVRLAAQQAELEAGGEAGLGTRTKWSRSETPCLAPPTVPEGSWEEQAGCLEAQQGGQQQGGAPQGDQDVGWQQGVGLQPAGSLPAMPDTPPRAPYHLPSSMTHTSCAAKAMWAAALRPQLLLPTAPRAPAPAAPPPPDPAHASAPPPALALAPPAAAAAAAAAAASVCSPDGCSLRPPKQLAPEVAAEQADRVAAGQAGGAAAAGVPAPRPRSYSLVASAAATQPLQPPPAPTTPAAPGAPATGPPAAGPPANEAPAAGPRAAAVATIEDIKAVDGAGTSMYACIGLRTGSLAQLELRLRDAVSRAEARRRLQPGITRLAAPASGQRQQPQPHEFLMRRQVMRGTSSRSSSRSSCDSDDSCSISCHIAMPRQTNSRAPAPGVTCVSPFRYHCTDFQQEMQRFDAEIGSLQEELRSTHRRLAELQSGLLPRDSASIAELSHLVLAARELSSRMKVAQNTRISFRRQAARAQELQRAKERGTTKEHSLASGPLGAAAAVRGTGSRKAGPASPSTIMAWPHAKGVPPPHSPPSPFPPSPSTPCDRQEASRLWRESDKDQTPPRFNQAAGRILQAECSAVKRKWAFEAGVRQLASHSPTPAPGRNAARTDKAPCSASPSPIPALPPRSSTASPYSTAAAAAVAGAAMAVAQAGAGAENLPLPSATRPVVGLAGGMAPWALGWQVFTNWDAMHDTGLAPPPGGCGVEGVAEGLEKREQTLGERGVM